MPEYENLMDVGLGALRSVQPTRGVQELLRSDRRRRAATRAVRLGIGSCAVLASTAVALVGLKPASAYALLSRSLRLSDSHAAMHFYSVSDSSQSSRHDIWLLRDRLVVKHDHILRVAFRDGRAETWDERFPSGTLGECAEWERRTLASPVTGTIADVFVRLGQQRYQPQRIEGVHAHGAAFTDFHYESQCNGNAMTDDIYVDPASNLIRFQDQQSVTPDGARYRSTTVVEYPKEAEALALAPSFPKNLQFKTRAEFRRGFLDEIKTPEQTRVVGGIRVNLYGVVAYPDGNHDGLRIIAITKGGAEADLLAGRYVEIMDGPMTGEKATDGLPNDSHIVAWRQRLLRAPGFLVGMDLEIGSARYNVSTSDALLRQVPSHLTIKVPVWRDDSAQTLTSHEYGEKHRFHPSILVGYATFTTTRIFGNGGDISWSVMDPPDRSGPAGN